MINKEMYELGVKPSAIRNLFEYGKQRKSLIGEENVFDFSLGNPNVPAPKIVNDTLKKLINENIKKYRCEICGNTEWQNRPIPLAIHHKDGNHFNNNLDNIQLLCPNCHALTESYCGKKNKTTRYCTECGEEISRWSQSGLCVKCARKKERVVERPSAEELQQLLYDTSFSAVGRKYGVSYRTVCKWCKYYNIPDSAKFYEKK